MRSRSNAGSVHAKLSAPQALGLGALHGPAELLPISSSGHVSAVPWLLGWAQAFALVPGVSRNGATLAAARLRHFEREDANRLSRHVALPVIAGATLLKGVRLSRRRLEPGTRVAFAAGAGASFASTLFSTWLIRQVERDRSLLPYAAYRAGLAAMILWRWKDPHRRRRK